MTKKQKIWLVGSVGFLLLCGAILGVGSFIQGQNAKTAALNEQIEASKKAIDDLQTQLDTENRLSYVDSVQKDAKISTLQSDLNKKQAPQNTATDIVNEWQNRVAKVQCNFYTSSGKYLESDQGSSTIMNLLSNSGGGILTAVTNEHVLVDSSGNYLAVSCSVQVPTLGERVIIHYLNDSKFTIGNPVVKGIDEGFIDLSDPITKTDAGKFDKSASLPMSICKPSQISVGDQIVILGYPTIGTQNGVTATEGIISGIENNYYVTSAKIDHGNSGGSAIQLKNDCWIGIPTEVVAGQLESLGRILKANFIISSN